MCELQVKCELQIISFDMCELQIISFEIRLVTDHLI